MDNTLWGNEYIYATHKQGYGPFFKVCLGKIFS